MAIGNTLIALLSEECASRTFSGKLMTFGRQTVLVPGLDDIALFRRLGFETIHSIDRSDFEGATHEFDLNEPDTPLDLREQYDVVLDSGTIEHIFCIHNALRHAVRMTKQGGRVIYFTPSSNHLEHGFHMPSPMFFFEYFSANKLRIETFYVLRDAHDARGCEAYAYEPGLWDDVQIGGLDGSSYSIFVVATKRTESTIDAIPQQKAYVDRWGLSALPADAEIPPFSSRSRERVKKLLSQWPRLYELGRRAERAKKSIQAIITRVPPGLQNKKLIGRY